VVQDCHHGARDGHTGTESMGPLRNWDGGVKGPGRGARRAGEEVDWLVAVVAHNNKVTVLGM